METAIVDVGDDVLDDTALHALARARTVVGPPELLAAVRHLCTPRATLVPVEDTGHGLPTLPAANAGQEPLVVLRAAGAAGDTRPAAGSSPPRPIAAVRRRADAAAAVGDPAAAAALTGAAKRHLDGLAKPPGSLGLLEDVGIQLCVLAGACPPPEITAPAVLVAAADHGVVASGVSAWPSAVTAAMVEACLSGGAGVAVFASQVGARLQVLDVGVAADVAQCPGLVRRPVRRGTRDLSRGPAMTAQEAAAAIAAGAEATDALLDDGADLLVPGDLGIGNTTAAACLVGALTGARADQVVGPGAGANEAVLARKRDVVAAVLGRHRRSGSPDPLGILADCGGLEHAALVGLMLAARVRRIPVVLDGVAAVAAALVATGLAPPVRHALIAGHRSTEPAAGLGLGALQLRPLLDLEMRLGEGTGGLLAVPLVASAAAAMTRMASLDEVAHDERA